MNKARLYSAGLLAAAVAAAVVAAAAEPGTGTLVRGVEARIALYASTNAPREAVAWLPGETVLAASGSPGDGDVWVQVAAPASVGVWIYRELVRDGRVAADKSQVRSGAGLAFRPVASLDRGTPVEVRGEFGDWLKITPPPGVRFWVLRDHVEPFAEEPPPPPPDLYAAFVEALTNAPAAAAAPAPPTPVPPPELSGYLLDDVSAARQGERVTVTGTLDWGGVAAVTAPFCLVARRDGGDTVPLCNLLAPEAACGTRIGTRMTVEGTRWFVKGSHLPFIIPLDMRMDE